MSSLYLQQVFWILVGTIVFTGIIRGVHHAVKRILGYSNDMLFGTPEKMATLGIIPVILLETGVFIAITRFFAETVLVFDSLLIGIGGVLAVGHTMIRKTGQKIPLVLVDGIIAGIASLMVSGFPGKVIEGSVAGLVVGVIEILIIRKILERSPEERGDLFPFWIAAWLMGWAVGGVFPEIIGNVIVWVSILTVWIIFLIAAMFHNGIALLVHYTGKIVFFFFSSLLILLRFRTILCNHCLRYTHPFHSAYNLGLRYCEHCFQKVEYTKDPGKVIFTFGDVLLEPEDRVFMFFNADVEHQDRPIDVSEVYIDTKTCDIRLLERFVTYLLHDPPEQGARSVKIFYSGKLDDLGANLKNVLQNNFTSIHPTPRSRDIPEKQSISFGYFPKSKNWGTQTRLLGDKDQRPTPPPLPPTERSKVRLTEGSIGGIIGLIWGSFSGFLIFIGFPAAFNLESLRFSQPFVQSWLAFFLISWVVLSWFSGIRKGIKSDKAPVWGIISLVLCILVNIALPGFITAANRSKVNQTTAWMRAIGTALGSYNVDWNYFPVHTGDWDPELINNNDQGWVYYDGTTKDAWGKLFYYDCKDGTWDDNGYSGYTLISYGKDRKPGGEGEFNSDIVYINGSFVAPSNVAMK